MRNLVVGGLNFTRETVGMLEPLHSQVSICPWAEAPSKITLNHPDIAILDLSESQATSFIVSLRQILQTHEGYAPVLVGLVPHETALEEQVKFYNLGFDLIVECPINPDMLTARIQALNRRVGREKRTLKSQHLLLDIYTHDVFLQNQHGELYGHFKASPMQFKILQSFVRNPRRIWSRESLDASLRPEFEKETDIRAIDTTIKRLRTRLTELLKKLPANSWAIERQCKDPFIHTEKGAGYFFQDRLRLVQEDEATFSNLVAWSSSPQARWSDFNYSFPYNLQDASIAWEHRKAM